MFIHWVMSISMRPHGLWHAGLPCPSLCLRICSTLVHWISDAIQPSCPLLPPSPLAFSLSRIRVFSNMLALCIRSPNCWSFGFSIGPFSKYSGLISFRMDWLDLLTVQGALKSLLQQIQNSNSFKSINSLALSLLYGPTLTLIYDYWENNSFHCKELGRQIDHSVL